jgi:hypothetical protein
MDKKLATADGLHAELDRRIRERARGPYSRYVNSQLPVPVPLDRRDDSGCNWTVPTQPVEPLAAMPFLELIITQLMREYDLVPG